MGVRLLAVARNQQVANEAEFRAWLRQKRGLEGRSLGDVVSRLRRVAGWIDILDARSDAEVVFWLTQDARFEACSTNVKSQMKRALTYFRSFYRDMLGKR